jgi:DNA ligase D-like protein (predicted polymerase)
MYPETGTTKADIFGYYNAVADVMIPHVRDRIATRKRWVHGVGTPDDPAEVFFQKNLDPASTPDWVRQASITHKTSTNTYPLVNDRATLIWLAQIASLEIHVPQWRVGRGGERKNPDRLVLDLDPGDGVTLVDCAEVARLARAILTDMGLDPMPVTSGSKGIHLYAALDGSQTSDQISAVAHELARALEADHPDLIVSDMKKSLRAGKVLVDWSQNNGAKTTIAPYSLRGRFHPTVAAPRTWRELASKNLEHLDYREVMQRLKRRGDPLAEIPAGHGATCRSRIACPPTARCGMRPRPPSRCPPSGPLPARDARSSSRSTTPGGSTGTSGSRTTAFSSAGRCRRARRPTPSRTTSRCTPRTIRSNTAASRATSRTASTAPGTSTSGTTATTSWRSGATTR